MSNNVELNLLKYIKKMNIKKYLAYAGIATVILAGATSMVLAEGMGNWHKTGDRDDEMEMKIHDGIDKAERAGTQMILQIGPSGKVTMRGIVDLVTVTSPTSSVNSIAVKTWGGVWKVNISSNTKVLPTSDLTQIKVGDFVGVHGDVNTTTAFTIDADIVKDWSLKKQENALKDSFTPKNVQGTASNVSGNSFTLMIDGTPYAVTVAAGAQIVNKNYGTISLSNISNGDTVRVWATVSGTTLTAYLVRDVSVQ